MPARLYHRTLMNLAHLRLTTRRTGAWIRSIIRWILLTIPHLVQDIGVFRDRHAIRSPINKTIIVLLFVLPLVYLSVLEHRSQAALKQRDASFARVRALKHHGDFLVRVLSNTGATGNPVSHFRAESEGV